MSETRPAAADRTAALRADCGRCAALCCVALAFVRSADFAVTKDAGDPCLNLQDDFRCTIHPVLRDRGFKGCTVFDCLGAGQQVTQVTFGGRSWREAPDTRNAMFAAFGVMRQLHELLWYLTQARAVASARPLWPDVDRALEEVRELTGRSAEDLLALDVGSHRERVDGVLRRVSDVARARVREAELAGRDPRGAERRHVAGGSDRRPGRPRRARGAPVVPGADLVGADLVGARLAGQELRGANLRGALLIAADLRGANLSFVDLIGADLRDADLAGADLAEALFVTQFQLNAAKGDADTKLPPLVVRPTHWLPAPRRDEQFVRPGGDAQE